MADVQQGARAGVLSRADVKKTTTDSQVTRLQSVVKNLSLTNALDVSDMATDDERQQLAPLILKKVSNFRKTEQEKWTPAERQRMDTRLARWSADL
jgi:hypothetical protein